MERSAQSAPMVHLLVRGGCACLHCAFWQYHFCDGLYDDKIYMADSETGSGCCSFSADVHLSAVMPRLNCGDSFWQQRYHLGSVFFPLFPYHGSSDVFEIGSIVNGGK